MSEPLTDIDRLIAWTRDPKREPPELAFTAGPIRMLADLFQAELARKNVTLALFAEKRRWSGTVHRTDSQCVTPFYGVADPWKLAQAALDPVAEPEENGHE